MSDEGQDIQTYRSTHEIMTQIHQRLSFLIAQGKYKSDILKAKKSVMKPGFMHAEDAAKGDYDNLWEELEDEWVETIQEYLNLDYLPAHLDMSDGPFVKLHDELDSIIEDKLKKAGMHGVRDQREDEVVLSFVTD